MKSTLGLLAASSVSLLTEDDSLLEHAVALQGAIAHRAFELFSQNGFQHGRDVQDWLQAEAEFLQPVALTVAESDDTIRLRAMVEGFSEKEIAVRADAHRVFIAASHSASSRKKKGRATATSKSSREIFREYVAPAEIVPEKVQAELKDGVLELTLPKAAAAKKPALAGKAA